MADAEDLDGVAEVAETDAVAAEADPELRRLDTLETADTAFFAEGESRQAMQQPQGDLPINRADVGLGLIGPPDLLCHAGAASRPFCESRPW